jgi:nucleoside-triphosphatase THEP1
MMRPFTRHFPCPICGGHRDLPAHHEVRCFGAMSTDERYAHCTRPEHAGRIGEVNRGTQGYPHRLDGPCPCGSEHGQAAAPVVFSGPSVSSWRSTGGVESTVPRRDPDHRYPYADEAGVVQYEVARWELPGGEKCVRPRCQKDGRWVLGQGGKTRLPYRLPEMLSAPSDGTILVVEGEKCVEVARAHGLLATTNNGGGGNWDRALDRWFVGRRVVILPDQGDPDAKGERHGLDVLEHLAPVAASVRIVDLPGLTKGDIADWFDARHTAEELVALLGEPMNTDEPKEEPVSNPAAPVPTPTVAPPPTTPVRARDALDELILSLGGDVEGAVREFRDIEEGKVGAIGLSTGIPELDAAIGRIVAPNVVGIVARPGVGKSALGGTVACHLGLGGYHVGLLSLEMTLRENTRRCLSIVSGVSRTRIKAGTLSAREWTAITSAAGRLRTMDVDVVEKSGIRMDLIAKVVRRMHERRPLDLLIVDHLGKIGRSGNTSADVGQVAKDIKDLARDLGIPVMVLCQMNRSIERREIKDPTMADIRESGDIEQECDSIVVITRDDNGAPDDPVTPAMFHVLKSRDDEHRNRKIAMNYRGSCFRFESPTTLVPAVQPGNDDDDELPF